MKLRVVPGGNTSGPVGGSVSADVRDLILLEGAARRLALVDQVAAELRAAVTLRDAATARVVLRKFKSLAALADELVAEHERSIL